MKRAKKLIAVITVVSLTLGTVVTVFAENSPTTSTTGKALATETSAPATDTQKDTKPSIDITKVYPDLKVKELHYYNHEAVDCGVYPEVAGMDALNKKLWDYVFKAYYYRSNNDTKDDYHFNDFQADYTVLDTYKYAVIEQTINYNNASYKQDRHADTVCYYIDKEAMAEITKDAYDAAIADYDAAVAAAEATPDAAANDEEEITMIPLREFAEALGFEVKYEETQKAIFLYLDGDYVTVITTDKNEYDLDGEKVALSSAPVNKDGLTYVPVDFFEKILDAQVLVSADGTVTVTLLEKVQ